MRAIEYAVKYGKLADANLTGDEFCKLASNMFKEMLTELENLVKARHVASISSLKSIEKEMNTKANKVSKMLGDPLKPDWFVALMDLKAPERFGGYA